MSEILVTAGMPRTGTGFLGNLLAQHKDISEQITSHELFQSDKKLFYLQGCTQPEIILTDEIKDAILKNRSSSFKYVLYWAGWLDSARLLLQYKPVDFKVIIPIRHPYLAMKSRRRMDHPLNPMHVEQYLDFINIIKNTNNNRIIPIDLYSQLSSDERLKKMEDIFDNWLGLEVTGFFREMILTWDPAAATPADRRELTEEEDTIIRDRIKKARLIELLNNIGLPYGEEI